MTKKWIYPAGVLIIALVAFYFYSKYNVAPAIDFNKISLLNTEQRPVSFSALKGKKMIVCFSASWCPNCLNELRELSAIKDSELKDVEVLVISDEPMEKILWFKDRTQYPFTFLKLVQPFNQVGIHSIPTSYLVNSRMEVTDETVGYINWKDPSTCEHLKRLMD